MAHFRMWKFQPPPGREAQFAAAYSANGPWSKLFGLAAGYRGTSLLRPSNSSPFWLTVDRWDSEDDFRAFQLQFGDEYRALDAELEGLAGEEQFVGAFDDFG